jgi:cytochrome P450
MQMYSPVGQILISMITPNALTRRFCIIEVPTFLLAGHDTTTALASWLLFELACSSEAQFSLRAECSANPLPASSKNCEPLDATELTILDKLPFLDAIVRETLRLHSPVPGVQRAAAKDDVIPLARPYVDRDGVLRESITINKGDFLWVPILTVNRSAELWGPDAKEWKPERWINGSDHDGVPEAVKSIPGVYSNMMSTFGGIHSCIGFRFALYE